MRRFLTLFLILVLSLNISGCSRKKRTVTKIGNKDLTYRVERGDTLSSIAEKYGVSVQKLQERNRISDPRKLQVATVLVIPGKTAQAAKSQGKKNQSKSANKADDKGKKKPTVTTASVGTSTVPPSGNPLFSHSEQQPEPKLKEPEVQFIRPLDGNVHAPFAAKIGGVPLEGIRLRAKPNEQVKAAGDGQVVFSGELEGYDKLVIVDHKNGFFTVYAKLSQLRAVLNNPVKGGDIVGMPGKIDDGVNGIHFEVRHHDLPVNPEIFLAKQ